MGGTGNGENWGLALMGRALLSKALMQFAADGWGCTPSLVVVWPEVKAYLPASIFPDKTLLATHILPLW